jgi:O-antigen ligase
VRKIAYIFVWMFCASIPLQELAASTLVEVSGTITRLVGVAAAVVGIAALLYDGKLRPFQIVHGVIVLYLVWGSLTYFWSASQTLSYARLITNVQLMVMVVLLAQFASREDEEFGLIAAYVLGATLSLFELFRRFLTGSSLVATMFHERYTAFENNPNDYALALAIAIPMGWFLASRKISFWTTALGYCYTGLGFVGVILTGSRGGLLAAVAGALIIPLSMFRLGRRERLAGMLVVGVGLLLAVRVTPDAVWNRFSTIGEVTEEVPTAELEGANIRTVIWKQGLHEFATNPQAATIGVGVGAYARGVEAIWGEELVAHNAFVSVLLEQGLVGFTLLLILLLLLAGTLKYLPPPERLLWFFVFFSWGVGVMFVTWEHTKNTWFIIGALAARGVSARYASEDKPGYLARLLRRTRIGRRLKLRVN